MTKLLLLALLLCSCATIKLTNTKTEYAKITAVEGGHTFVSFGDGTGTIYKGNLGTPGTYVKVERK